MTRKDFLRLSAAAFWKAAHGAEAEPRRPFVLQADAFRHYIDYFNGLAKEEVVNVIPDAGAWEFLRVNIPFFTCPDNALEQIYYYRWWTYRKHIKQTPAGFLITEFLKPVPHASEFNALSCALGHHIAEGRWLHDPQFIEGDIHFWLRSGENGGIRKNLHQFSGWTAAAVYDCYLVHNRPESVVGSLDPLLQDWAAWETERLTPSGLFWQRDVSDGMESSISGGRRVQNIRPSINSYMYGNAKAISAIGAMAGKDAVAREYREKAARLKQLVQEQLWNKDAAFFETRLQTGEFADVRENIGFTPWYFNLPDDRAGYEAWKQLMDPEGFYAPFGPTTAERRHKEFAILYSGDDCQWNGPGWPFSTALSLCALANVLNDYHQDSITRDDYFRTLEIYVKDQHLTLDDGRVIPWIDEDQNPLTGEWVARADKIRKKTFYGRGDYYNHSSFCDLVITGLSGLRPRADGIVEVSPLVPAGKWDWFCLDNVLYHGRLLTVLWDKSGAKFGKGKGLRVFSNGKEIARSAELGRVTGKL
jgi:hypothetical protein